MNVRKAQVSSTGTMTSKGQITIPKEVREKLRLKAGNRIDFQIDAAGKMVLTPRNKDFRSLKGLMRSKRSRPASLKEMDEAIAGGVAER